jgi:DNA modification methylase
MIDQMDTNTGVFELVPISRIRIPEGRREVKDFEELADSIKEIGLLNPISVTSELCLIAGRNRIEACKSLGWDSIPALVVKLDRLHAELAEIDENLIRNELSVLERAESLARRKEIYELIYPDTRSVNERGGPGRGHKKTGAKFAPVLIPETIVPPTPSFVSDTAKKTGQSERSVQLDVQIAKSISEPVREKIRETPLADRKDDLLKLARLTPEQQEAVVDKVITSPVPLTVPQAQRAVANEQKRIENEAKSQAVEEVLPGTDRPWQIFVGDCLEILPSLDPSIAFGEHLISPRLIFADPPYNIGIDYGEHMDDSMCQEDFIEWSEAWIRAAADLLAPDGSLWVMINDEWADVYGCLLRDAGLHRRAWIKWYETFGVNCSNNFNRCSRHIFYMVKDREHFVFDPTAVHRPSDRQVKYGDSRADPGGKIWDDVWGINPPLPRLVGTARERIPDFPTQLPLALLTAVVDCASEPGDLVLDPFNGSGTTGEAALRLKRRYIGIEKSAQFAELARLRLITAEAESRDSAGRSPSQSITNEE